MTTWAKMNPKAKCDMLARDVMHWTPNGRGGWTELPRHYGYWNPLHDFWHVHDFIQPAIVKAKLLNSYLRYLARLTHVMSDADDSIRDVQPLNAEEVYRMIHATPEERCHACALAFKLVQS